MSRHVIPGTDAECNAGKFDLTSNFEISEVEVNSGGGFRPGRRSPWGWAGWSPRGCWPPWGPEADGIGATGTGGLGRSSMGRPVGSSSLLLLLAGSVDVG